MNVVITLFFLGSKEHLSLKSDEVTYVSRPIPTETELRSTHSQTKQKVFKIRVKGYYVYYLRRKELGNVENNHLCCCKLEKLSMIDDTTCKINEFRNTINRTSRHH